MPDGSEENHNINSAKLDKPETRQSLKTTGRTGRSRMIGRIDIPFTNRQINALGVIGVGLTTAGLTMGAEEVKNNVYASGPQANPGIALSKDEKTSASVVIEPINPNPYRIDAKTDNSEKEYQQVITDKELEDILNVTPENQKENARTAIPLIIEALQTEGFSSRNVIAYALATVDHEAHFEARKEIEADVQAELHGYEGGVEFHGRGYIQLTGKSNYKKIGEYLGLDLVNNPDLLLDPRISAKALAAFFKLYGTGELADKGEFLEARKTVNAGEFESDEEHYFRTPYNIAARTEDFLKALETAELKRSINKELDRVLGELNSP